MEPDKEESSLTDRYQTTVPSRIRKQLGLSKRDKLQWIIDDSGTIILRKAEAEESDPIFDAWLGFLEKDIFEHPERLVPLDDKWYEEMAAEFNRKLGDEVPRLPATLEDFLKQSHIQAISEEF